MFLFILFFLTLYGGLNSYIYYTVASGLGKHSWPVAVGLIFLVFSPIVLRLSERKAPRVVSVSIAWIGYNWMGIGFLFAVFALMMDMTQILVPGLTDRTALFSIIGLTSAASLYGFLESRKLRVLRYSVRSPKVEYREGGPFRMVQISDLHLGYGTLPGQVRKVVRILRSLNPDLVVSSGDLFDTDLDHLGPYVDLLKTVSPPDGKLAITGNHEVYAGLEQAINLTEQSGFQVLRSSHSRINNHLYVAGVDDPEALGRRSVENAETASLKDIPENAFTILLKHRPHILESNAGRFDLQLSGHTHGGQIFPFIFMTRLQYKARHGLSKVAGNSYLYLSRGTGTWGPQIRLLAPPEITVFELSTGQEFTISSAGRYKY